MEQITFDHVIPKVFATVEDLNSEIWNSTAIFKRGGLYLVEAASGKGKSTFCSYVIGYRNDYTGKILFDNDDIKDYKSGKWSELRRNSISHLFQELRLFPELTAMENVLIKNQLTQHSDTEKLLSWFERLGIPEKTDQKIGMMSFGQQQRVAMMRALAQPFDVLLVDEPISHLDDYNSQIMADIMMEEAKKQNACVIVTSIGKHMNLPYDKTYKL
ncbi:MAG: ATP-binding cassette domain-containing protein [Prevotella sp.]|nr:ATP-binding cassette domain-containing protein [Prevotella sp.]